jgi:hypothetical protein
VHVNENSGEFQRVTTDLTVTIAPGKIFGKKTNHEIIWPDLSDIDQEPTNAAADILPVGDRHRSCQRIN